MSATTTNKIKLLSPMSPDPYEYYDDDWYKLAYSSDSNSDSDSYETNNNDIDYDYTPTSPSYCPVSPASPPPSPNTINETKLLEIIQNNQEKKNKHDLICEFKNGKAFYCPIYGNEFSPKHYYGFACQSWRSENWKEQLSDEEKKMRKHADTCELLNGNASDCSIIHFNGGSEPSYNKFTYSCRSMNGSNWLEKLSKKEKNMRTHAKDCEYLNGNAIWCKTFRNNSRPPNPNRYNEDIKLICGIDKYYGTLASCDICGEKSPKPYCNNWYCFAQNEQLKSNPNNERDQIFRLNFYNQQITNLTIQLKKYKRCAKKHFKNIQLIRGVTKTKNLQ